MQRGNLKRPTTMRLEPQLVAAVKAFGVPLTMAVEEALVDWLAKQARRSVQARQRVDPLAKHLQPASAREVAVRSRRVR